MLRIFRFFLLGILATIAHVVSCVPCLLRPKNPKNAHIIARCYAMIARFLGIRVHRKISPKVDISQPAVYIANHQSNWDLIVLTSMVMPNTVAVGKKSLIWVPFFGQLFWLSGNVLIDRGNRKKAHLVVDTMVESIIQRKVSVWLFPEGTRSKGRGLLPFKTGAFYTAIKAGVPIIPVICQPYAQDFDLNRACAADVQLEMLDPIDTSAYTLNNLRDLMDTCYRLYQAKLGHFG